MLRSLYITCIYLTFLVLGVSAPFVFSLGYVWVDTFTPQSIAYMILPDIPVSLIMAVAAIVGYILMDRKYPPNLNLTTVLTLILAIWSTLSTFFWAVAPDMAFAKWNVAVKVLLFSAFIPLIFRSRVQIESFFLIYLFSLVVQFLPAGIKTAISGGGYGYSLGIVAGNSGLSEGSTLAAVSLMLVPIILYLRKHSLLVPRSRWTNIGYLGLVAGAVFAAIGTYERTALVGMAVVGLGLWVRSRYKVAGAVLGMLIVAAFVVFSSASWTSRIETTTDYENEASALGRLLVWQWTLGFVADHPQGGGFNSYVVNEIVFPMQPTETSPTIVHGKAFHSIYFEVLGEQGWVGLALFGGIIAASLANLRTAARRSKNIAGLEWCRDLAFSLQVALLCLLACGAFIGIAFQPMLYYLFAMATCIRQYVRRVEEEGKIPRWQRSGALGASIGAA